MIIEVVTVKVIVEAKTKLDEKRENNLKKETHLEAQKTIIDIFWAHYPCSPLSLSRKNKQTQGSRHEASQALLILWKSGEVATGAIVEAEFVVPIHIV